MGDRLAIRNSKSASNLKTSDLKSEIPRATNTSSGVACTERQNGEESEQISMAQRSPQTERVLVHPINVGQGDAILLEIQSTDGQSEKHLIDGGYGQKGKKKYYYENLKRTLMDRQCLVKKQVRMDSIIVTHPDRDHYGGINRLLQDFTITAPITTTLASCLKVNGSDTQLGEVFLSGRDQIRHYFPLIGEGENGRRHACANIKRLSKGSTVEVAKNERVRFEETETEEELSEKQRKAKFNATSILTTVQLQESTYDYDVVLTGDSYCAIIKKKLALEDKSVGVFQVPHHGSKYNFDDKKGTNRSTAEEFTNFYSSFKAYIYLISHGKGYEHPHSEVITGILSAAVQKKRDPKCKIVVTATWFEEREIDKIRDWRKYVNIFYFKKDTPYVTLDPNDKQRIKGLQLLVKKESEKRDKREPTIEKDSSSATPCNKSEETPITENSKSRINSMKPKALFKSHVPEKDVALLQPSTATPTTDESHELDCTVCGEQTEPTCVIMCKQCNSRAHANKVCTRYARASKNYLCDKCRTCTVCNELTNESGTHTAVCKRCGSRAHANEVCTHYARAPRNYLCAKCRTCTVCNGLTKESGTYTAVCKRCGSRAHANAKKKCTPYKRANKASKEYVCKKCVSELST